MNKISVSEEGILYVEKDDPTCTQVMSGRSCKSLRGDKIGVWVSYHVPRMNRRAQREISTRSLERCGGPTICDDTKRRRDNGRV